VPPPLLDFDLQQRTRSLLSPGIDTVKGGKGLSFRETRSLGLITISFIQNLGRGRSDAGR
jgi:hypothetical protein